MARLAPTPPARPEEPPETAALASDTSTFASTFEMHDLYCFDSATVETTLAPFTNTTPDTAAIHRAANKLMRLYRDAGY